MKLKRNPVLAAATAMFSFWLVLTMSIALLAPQSAFANGSGTTEVPLVAFQPSGPQGPLDVLPPNAQYPPLSRNSAIVKRTAQCVEYSVETSGLPPGAYTNWLLVINKPEQCKGDCTLDDFFTEMFGNPASQPAAFWAAGGVVGADGWGDFHRRVCIGDDLGFPGDWMLEGDISRCRDGELCTQDRVIGPQHLFGEFTNPKDAALVIIVKDHGRASGDPVTLYDQTHTLLGSCAEGANGLPGPPPIVQCFDPQVAVFPGPK